jgi:hypothetical protein
MGIETILYCFIADEEMFAVNERFAEAELVGTLAHAEESHKSIKAQKREKKGCGSKGAVEEPEVDTFKNNAVETTDTDAV